MVSAPGEFQYRGLELRRGEYFPKQDPLCLSTQAHAIITRDLCDQVIAPGATQDIALGVMCVHRI